MTNELVTIPAGDGNPYAIMPVMDIEMALYRRNMLVQYTKSLMDEGRDYGRIPGAGDKPTLLKPGAEKLISLFGLTPDFGDPVESVMDWTGEAHGGEPLFYVKYRCRLSRGDMVVGEGLGSCNSWEKKYRYRSAERVCPECGQPAIIKGKDEYGGGWLCFKKKGGCGYKYPDGDGRIESQVVGQVKNPDIADIVNTIDKMAQKRALIAAVLIAVNASEFYTQDIEDYADVIEGEWQPAATQPKATQPKPAPAKTQAPTPINGKYLYANGVVVRPEKLADYNAYREAHGGDVPESPRHLDNWYKQQQQAAAGLREVIENTPIIDRRMLENMPAVISLDELQGNAQPAQQAALVIEDADAEKAGVDTAMGLFD